MAAIVGFNNGAAAGGAGVSISLYLKTVNGRTISIDIEDQSSAKIRDVYKEVTSKNIFINEERLTAANSKIVYAGKAYEDLETPLSAIENLLEEGIAHIIFKNPLSSYFGKVLANKTVNTPALNIEIKKLLAIKSSVEQLIFDLKENNKIEETLDRALSYQWEMMGVCKKLKQLLTHLKEPDGTEEDRYTIDKAVQVFTRLSVSLAKSTSEAIALRGIIRNMDGRLPLPSVLTRIIFEYSGHTKFDPFKAEIIRAPRISPAFFNVLSFPKPTVTTTTATPYATTPATAVSSAVTVTKSTSSSSSSSSSSSKYLLDDELS